MFAYSRESKDWVEENADYTHDQMSNEAVGIDNKALLDCFLALLPGHSKVLVKEIRANTLRSKFAGVLFDHVFVAPRGTKTMCVFCSTDF